MKTLGAVTIRALAWICPKVEKKHNDLPASLIEHYM